MGLMQLLSDLVPALSVPDVPGGRSIFGPFEPFVALGTPFTGDGDPTEEEVTDALLDAGSSLAPVGSGGLAGPALSHGKENVRHYNSRRKRKIDHILSNETRGEVQKSD